MHLEENFKRLVRELGNAINDSLSESQRVAETMEFIRAAGYDIFLIVEVTVGFNQRGQGGPTVRRDPILQTQREIDLPFTPQDAQFLRALKIRVDDETL